MTSYLVFQEKHSTEKLKNIEKESTTLSSLSFREEKKKDEETVTRTSNGRCIHKYLTLNITGVIRHVTFRLNGQC